MGFEITYPSKPLPLTGTQSFWFAIHNPLIVRFFRNDFNITLSGDGTTTTATITAGTFPAMSSGDKIYIGGFTLKGNFVLNANVTAGATTFTFLSSFNSTTGGYVNCLTLYPNYYANVKYKLGDGTKYNEDSPHRLDPTGLAKIDISAYIKSAVNMIDEFEHDAINKLDDNLSMKMKIQFEGVYDGGSDSSSDQVIYIVNAANQIGYKFGNNLADFVTESTGVDRPKFITAFKSPTYFPGYPWDVGFLYSDSLGGASGVSRNEEARRSNGVVSFTVDAIDTSQKGYLNRLMLKGSYLPGCDSVVLYLGKNIVKFLRNEADTDYIKNETGQFLEAEGGGTGTFYSEKLTVKLSPCIPRNAVYLKWIGTGGSWNYWLFGVNQLQGITTSSGGLFAKFSEDLFTQESDSEFLTKGAIPEMTLGADQLTKDDIGSIFPASYGLMSIVYSPKVQLLMNPDTWEDDGEIWQTVKVDVGRFKGPETKHYLHAFEFIIKLVELQIQSQ